MIWPAASGQRHGEGLWQAALGGGGGGGGGSGAALLLLLGAGLLLVLQLLPGLLEGLHPRRLPAVLGSWLTGRSRRGRALGRRFRVELPVPSPPLCRTSRALQPAMVLGLRPAFVDLDVDATVDADQLDGFTYISKGGAHTEAPRRKGRLVASPYFNALRWRTCVRGVGRGKAQ